MKSLFSVPLLAFSLALSSLAQAQTWPSKPIKIVVAFAAGGAADQLARHIAPALQEALGQTVVVDNKAGAGGNIGADNVAKSPPDGYTLLLGSGGIFSINPHLYKTMPFNPAKDLVPVASVALVPQYLIVRPESGFTDLAKLVADLKANPGKRSYGSPGVGSSGHLAAEMLLGATHTRAIHVPYRGAAPALTDLLGGQVTFLFDSGASLQYIESGKLKLLGVGSPNRVPALPNAPTLDELGLKGFNADTVFGLYAPAGTPQAIISRVNAEVNRALKGPAGERILAGGQVPRAQTVEQFARGTAEDFERYGTLIRENGIRAD